MYRLFGIDLKSWVSIISWIWYANTHHTHLNVCRLQMNWKFDRNYFLKYSTSFFSVSLKYKTSDNCLIFCRTDVICRFHCNSFAMILHAHATVTLCIHLCTVFKMFMITTCATHLKHLATAHVLIKKHVWLRIELFYRESQPIAIISKHRRLC